MVSHPFFGCGCRGDQQAYAYNGLRRLSASSDAPRTVPVMEFKIVMMQTVETKEARVTKVMDT